jgi:hypothetical protein
MLGRQEVRLSCWPEIANVGVDFLLGSIPLVGDAFDVAWKANRKNARLLEQHLRATTGLRDLRPG